MKSSSTSVKADEYRYADYVAQIVAAAPPLTPQQVQQIARIIKSGERP